MTETSDYHKFASTTEVNRWNVENDIDWNNINKDLARSQPEVLAALRDAALIESYHPMSTLATIQLFIDDVDAASILQVEQFEGFRHFWVLRRYLDAVGFEPKITDEEIIGHRTRNFESVKYTEKDKIQVLINFTWSEHFAGYFFKRLEKVVKEPVLRSLMQKISADEFRHAHGGFMILQKLVDRHPEAKQEIAAAARGFRHYGNDVTDVPISLSNDFEAIMKVARKTQRICELSLDDILAEA